MSQTTNEQLHRTMKSRHLFMIALGGVIGTGFFLGSGYTIHEAGPGGAILSYLVGGFIMYLTMLCLGELTVAMPVSGSFQKYATKFIGPGTGFMIGWLYWLGWAVTVGLELTSIGLMMKRWFPDVNVWVWCLVFGSLLFISNAVSAKSYAELEFWFSSIKVVTIIAFILLGGSVLLGFLPYDGKAAAPLFSNFVQDGGLFPHGIGAVLLTMITVNFSFQGTELIGIAAGESKEPEKTIPRAIRNTVWRIMLFFVLTMTILVGLIDWKEAGVIESPFVVVFDKIGIPYAADIMNFVIITALLSVANSGLYAATRILWSLANEGMAPTSFKKLNKRGIPVTALVITVAVAALSLLTSVFAESTVYMYLLSVAGLSAVASWVVIAFSQIRFRQQHLKNGGKLEDLKYKTPLYPIVPIAALILNSVVVISLAFIPEQRMALYCGIPFIIFCYVYYYISKKRKQKVQAEMGNAYETDSQAQ
ncbi:amino acid permease [Bacillus sp. S13(2024)]|uniref:amino acid permease n=1 Tax=unclassified Bacillus (in: firmicutes) TaxID=185979 RepID=UPI003D1C9E89